MSTEGLNALGRTPEEEWIRKREMEECPTCNRTQGMMPPHFASSFCESNGRRWDPEAKTLVGNAHCSCDFCF